MKKIYTFAPPITYLLTRGVMVALQILVLSV